MPVIAGSTYRLPALHLDKGGAVRNIMHPEYGAVGDGVADDTAAIQAAIDDAITDDGGVVWIPPGNFLVTSTLTIPYCNYGLELRCAPAAVLNAQTLAAGTFAIDLVGAYHARLLITLLSTGNGVRIRNEGTAAVNNSLYNSILPGSRIAGPGRAASKTAIGVGSVGVLFGSVDSGDSNYFHWLSRVKIAEFDTCVRMDADANGQRLNDLQLESYWYGVDIDADECVWSGGFCHFSGGNSSSEKTEGYRIRAGRTFNTIRDVTMEPGGDSQAGYIEAGASGNTVDIQDNTGGSSTDLGTNNSINTASAGTNYAWGGLLENTFYRLGSFDFPTDSNMDTVVLEYTSRAPSTTGRSTGRVVATVNRSSAGVIAIANVQSDHTGSALGYARFAGWQVSGDTIYPVFYITNNGTATDSCEISVKMRGGGAYVRSSSTTTSAGLLGTPGSASGITDFAKISLANGPYIYSGSGAPTNDDPVGSVYLRTDGSAGATLYVKEASGAGGWAAV